MAMDDLKNKKKLGEMMTESLSPENSALNAPETSEESGNKSLYQEYLKPLIEEKMKQHQADMAREQQVTSDNSAIMNDKFKMAMNPNLQGPPQPGVFDQRLPAELENQKKYMAMALGTMGSSGGGKLGGWATNPKNIEYQKSLVKNTTEGLVGKLNAAEKATPASLESSREGLVKAENWLKQKLDDPNVPLEIKKKAQEIVDRYIKNAEVRGIKK